MAKTKLEGFSRVAVLKFGASYPYYFALYDDGTDYKIGDMVVVSGELQTKRNYRHPDGRGSRRKDQS